MFAPSTGAPYYPTWRTAIRCWVKEPARRPSMDEVAQLLEPKRKAHSSDGRPGLRPRVARANYSTDASETAFEDDDAFQDADTASSYSATEDDAASYEDAAGTLVQESCASQGYCFCEGVGVGNIVGCSKESDCKLQWVRTNSSVLLIRADPFVLFAVPHGVSGYG